MTQAEKQYKKHSGRLETMQARRSELQESYQQAQDALKVSGFADDLIEGNFHSNISVLTFFIAC